MKKLKTIISTLIVAVCAFLMTGCGELNAKQAVTGAVEVSQSIQTTASSMANMGDDGNLAMSSSFFGSELLNQIAEITNQITNKAGEIATTLSTYAQELVKLQTSANEFVENYQNLEVLEEDVKVLNDELDSLKRIKKNIEKDYKTLEEKMEKASKEIGNIFSDSLSQDTISSMFSQLEIMVSDAVALLNKGVGYISTAFDSIQEINKVVEKYVAE